MKRTPRPRDPVQLGKLMVDIMTGQVPDAINGGMTVNKAKGAGLKGGPARAAKLTPEQRSDIARLGSDARWKKS